ncbi:DAZ-associated protein 2-like isoform X2 [Gigantopelta aegis]|uniref:DAZ-associated protein 2-like isoform X2 n=1 Tax=Gigantopelta aegis TaxID=1735272 RepID=UPI001B888BDA|nr:DAZ-associated protein 2-like isoform X2 [Gigantopelta aegis]
MKTSRLVFLEHCISGVEKPYLHVPTLTQTIGPKQSQPPPYTNAQPAAQSMPMAPPAAPLPTNVPGAYPQAQYQQFQPPVVMAGNIYDSGARFDGVAQPSIPPPPPGYAPSGAQMAAMHGNAVVGTQQQAGWLTGGSGGGMTLW